MHTTVNTVYWGINLNAGNLPGSDLFNQAMNGIIEFPGLIAMMYLSELPKIGRRKFNFGALWLTGIFYLASEIVQTKITTNTCDDSSKNLYEILTQILAYLGKMCVAGAMMSVNQYTSEFYSTDVRADAYGLTIFLGKIGSLAAPYIIGVAADFLPMLPGIIFMILCGVSGTLCWWLPETLGRPMVLKIHELNDSI